MLKLSFSLIMLGLSLRCFAHMGGTDNITIHDEVAFEYNPDFTSVLLRSNVFFLPEALPEDSLISALIRFKPFDPEKRLNGPNWIFFSLGNNTAAKQNLFLEIENTTISQVRIYCRIENKVLPLSPPFLQQLQRPFKNNRHFFPLTLLPHSSAGFFLYVYSPGSFKLPLLVSSPVTHAESQGARNFIYGPYYGVLIFVLLFSISLTFAFNNERIYLYYSLYILALIILFLDLNGVGMEYLWRGNQEIDYEVVTVVGAIVLILFLKFTEHFLHSSLQQKERRIFTLFLYAFILNAVISSVMIFSQAIQIIHFVLFEMICVPLFFVMLVTISLRALRKKFKPALLLILAVAFLLFGFIANLMRVFEWIPNIWITQHSVQFGNLLEIMTLTIGLVFWFRINYDERQALLIKVGEHQREMTVEKNRIAQDLHDNIGTQLTSLSLGLDQLIRNRSFEPKKLKTLYDHANSTILELRDTIWVINKSEVFADELKDKLNNLLWRLRQQDDLTSFQLKTEGQFSGLLLQPGQAINLFRIAQEAINNSIKHSGASLIIVSLKTERLNIQLQVEDNGKGFNTNDFQKSDHYGLINMKKRADEIKGTLVISADSNGTSIRVAIYI